MALDYEPNEAVTALHKLLVTETNCPEILPYRSDLVAFLQEMMEKSSRTLKKSIKNLESSAVAADVDGDDDLQDEVIVRQFRAHFYQMDIERIRYALARYLRIRLQKIENTLDYIHSDLAVFDRLSEQERHFANKLQTLNREHIDQSLRLTGDIHTFVTSSNDIYKHSAPNREEFVIARINNDITMFQDSAEGPTPKDFKAGALCVFKYNTVQEELFKLDASGAFANDDNVDLL